MACCVENTHLENFHFYASISLAGYSPANKTFNSQMNKVL